MIIIGVDSAINRTGVAIYNSGHNAIIWSKQICPSKKFSFYEKLLYIKSEFQQIFQLCFDAKFIKVKNEIVVVAFEDQFLMSNRKVLKQLSMVRGVIQCMAMELWGINCVFVYTATAWRKVLGIKANRQIENKKNRVQDLKNQAMRIAKRKSKVQLTTEDEAEAACIALAHLEILQGKENGKKVIAASN